MMLPAKQREYSLIRRQKKIRPWMDIPIPTHSPEQKQSEKDTPRRCNIIKRLLIIYFQKKIMFYKSATALNKSKILMKFV